MKKTNKTADGTSFHNVTIKSTINILTDTLGHPQYYQNTGEDKVNVEWICETESGNVVTIYDWREHRTIGVDEEIEFHLGGHNKIDTIEGKIELDTVPV
jgi:hypothetical protein